MILSVLFMLLFIVTAAGVFCFLFFLFLPTLKTQNVNTSNPLLSKDEFTDDKELLVSVPELASLQQASDTEQTEDESQFIRLYGNFYSLEHKVAKLSLKNEKVFKFWSKWYKIFYNKKEI